MSVQGPTLSRRSLIAGALGAGALVTGFRAIGSIFGETNAPEHRFVACYFSGGWDVLLSADPRDPSGNYPGIDLGLGRLAAAYRTPMPVSVGGTETLWGAAMAPLIPHADRATVFRGVNMNTVAHPTGRAYVNTYRQPAGVVARGSSLSTVVSAIAPVPPERILPNVSIGVPSFNDNLGAEHTAVSLQVAPEIVSLLSAGSQPLPGEVESLLLAAQDQLSSCVGDRYAGARPAEQLRSARARVRQLLADDVARHFDLAGDGPAMSDLRARYGFTPQNVRNQPRTPGVVAATAGQLIKTGLSRAVSCQLQGGLDTHGGEWGTAQPARLQDGFDALAALISDLREDDPNLERTTVIAYSEFSRTPRLNGRGGRDHWFANSMLVFSGALVPGVVGATRPDNLGLQTVDTTTGLAHADGVMLIPEHVGATLVKALGGDPSPFRAPTLDAWIAGGAA